MSPRSQEQLAEVRSKSKKKILDAALALFAHQGFHNTTVEEVADKASVAKGSIYTYFSSKMKLLEGIIEDLMEEGDEILKQMEHLTTPSQQLAFLIHTSFDYMKRNQHHTRLLTALALQLEQFPTLEEIIKSRYITLMPFMAELLKSNGYDDHAAQTEARLLSAALDGIGIQYLILKDAIPLEEIKEELLAKYCPIE